MAGRMNLGIHFNNLWVFYVLAYAIAFPLRTWANAKRGDPIEDLELSAERIMLLVAALTWILGGFVISLFVPLNFGFLFYVGIFFYLLGIIIAGGALYSLAYNPGFGDQGILPEFEEPIICWLDIGHLRHEPDGLVDLVVEHPLPGLLLTDHPQFSLD
jgi:hypothetical protein